MLRNICGTTDTYYETFEVLANNGYIERKNLETYKKMVGLRNKLVHEYDRVSNEIVYDVIHNNLGDFDTFKSEMLKKF